MLRFVGVCSLLGALVGSSVQARRTTPGTTTARPTTVVRQPSFLRPMVQPSVVGVHLPHPDLAAVGVLRERIADLNGEIVRLETENGQKVAHALELRSDIQERRAELERDHRQRQILALFGALMGRPVFTVVGAINMMNDDARLKQLHAELGAVEVERTGIQAKIAAHASRKAGLERDLAHLQPAERHLTEDLRGQVSVLKAILTAMILKPSST
jgi:hypothetical protein